MLRADRAYLVALGQGLLATAIWSSSFVLHKAGMEFAGPVTLAGSRYFLGFLVLLPLLAPAIGTLRGPGRLEDSCFPLFHRSRRRYSGQLVGL